MSEHLDSDDMNRDATRLSGKTLQKCRLRVSPVSEVKVMSFSHVLEDISKDTKPIVT